jgi:hypothetical protein
MANLSNELGISKNRKLEILKENNYVANPVMKMMFGEECYNWRNPKAPTSIEMSDVYKTIKESDLDYFETEGSFRDFIKSKLNK